ncbi:Proprotein convertase subtilisin/kexin type 6 [Stylophora pistillata]|uniref:Proprotein convertase subtilisin/kexin type 6 n=1 Tax=Stylophora pistillata TaxID=50429 RepID=A0A2B4SI47_STYPI|nr:Proprotein convertase subtilisin/kexin type 6 [Stylophora pistillata]
MSDLSSGQRIQDRLRQFNQRRQENEDWRKYQSWHLNSTTVSLNVAKAWSAGYTGKGVLVAVVDDGVNKDHPDLVSNLNFKASYDFLSNRRENANHNSDSHGTQCAGIIAGGNNTKCGVGIAFESQISSIRLYDETINRYSTDELEAKALSFKRDMIDIYSNSWGPGDRPFEVEGPGSQLRDVLYNGTRLGRKGKGSIFVFAAGNGGVLSDSCAYNGYVNSVYTIAISGVNHDGTIPAYAEPCASIMAVTYGQDMFRYGKYIPPVVTVKGSAGCTEKFPGSSGATAMASGIIALALQANSNLTWRDVQHIVVRSSQPIRPAKKVRSASRSRPIWTENAAGLKTSSSSRVVIRSHENSRFTLTLRHTDCGIRYLEHVQAEINLQFPRRGELEMVLTSPGRTESKLLYPRVMDTYAGFQNYTNLQVTSLAYWGEEPTGDWKITIGKARKRWRTNNNRKGRIFGLKLILYGTKKDPLAENYHVHRNIKKVKVVNIDRRKREIPIHGGYSWWSYWGECSEKCGKGTQKRYRKCTNPPPENNGRDCKGPSEDLRSCRGYRCPVDGGYSQWTKWSNCNVECENGTQERRRSCNSPRPRFDGKPCVGSNKDERSCSSHAECQKRVCGNIASPTSCQRHFDDGMCSNPSVRRMCRKTCGLCPVCANIATEKLCQKYFDDGLCSNPSMRGMCQAKCGLCPVCKNALTDSQCQKYFNDGSCSESWVKKACRKTCLSC